MTPAFHLHHAQWALQERFRNTVLAWSQSDTLVPLFADLRHPPGGTIRIARMEVPVSSMTEKRFSLGDMAWPELGVHSYPYTCLLCVLEGEADIRIGPVPRSMKAEEEAQIIQIFSLPQRSLLIIPPGVPFSDGKMPHWERAHPETASSQILWIKILPTGAIMHLCQTRGPLHTHRSAVFLKDAQLSVLTQFMLDKAPVNRAADPLTRSYLTTIFLNLDQDLAAGRDIADRRPGQSDEYPGSEGAAELASDPSNLAILRRACDYIQSHLNDKIAPGQIARHSYASLPQLKRIFRTQLGTSIMKYVARQRLEEARVLLLKSGLTIGEISEICGYNHRSHFSRAFKAHHGLSPQKLRAKKDFHPHGTASLDP